MNKSIVIIGGGYTGVIAAKKLHKRLKGKADITLIDKNPFHTMLTELHEVAGGRTEPDSIRIPYDTIFGGTKVESVTDTITHIDTTLKKVTGKKSSYTYDYLVLCAGSEPEFFGVSGAKENAFRLWSYDDAVTLRRHIENCILLSTKEPDKEKRAALLTFVVVGAGFTGVELTGELSEWLPQLCYEYGVDRNEIRLICADVMEEILPILKEKARKRVLKRLYKQGIELMTGSKVEEIGEKGLSIANKHISASTVVWTAGVRVASIIDEVGKSFTVKGRGRIQTDEYLQAAENVYIGGDNLYFIDETNTTVPQMVENAEQSAETIAHNIYCDITETNYKISYKPNFHGIMVSVGSRYATAQLNLLGKTIILPSFFSMLIKHFINLVYFWQIAGYRQCRNYLKHEFFARRDRRSIFGGLFANRKSGIWLLPLRIFTGVYWIIEAVEKIADGWLKSPELTSFFSGADAYFSVAFKGGSEAMTSATATTEAVSEQIFNFRLLWFFNPHFIKSGGEYALRILFSPVTFFINEVVLYNNTSQLIFQWIIIISELLIGALLVLGCFNFFANAYALLLQLMFLMTTGLYLGTWWLIFASIALLFGGGMAFGLDYYLLPALKSKYKNTKLSRKWYLYND